MLTIKYEKTGLEIKIDNKRGYLMLTTQELEALGYTSSDVWERETGSIKMDEMDTVFKKAKTKVVEKIGTENGMRYTATPWDDFTEKFLIRRLEEEIEEWKEKYDKNELLDIINLAVFVFLCDSVGWE